MSSFDLSEEDESVVAALREGLAESDPVPTDVTEFARAAFSWREIDAELAELEFDSIDEDVPQGVRSPVTARMVSFQVGQWMLDIEYDESSRRLIGAISPETAYKVELHSSGGRFSAESDQAGRFEADEVEPGLLSMVLYFRDGGVIKTQWVIL